MGAPWSRVVNSTIRDYVREETVNTLRNRKLSALFQKRGRISYNHSGIAMDWKARYRQVPLTPFADGDTITFARQDRDKTAVLDWRGYSAADAMSKGEFLQNRGEQAIIKLFSTRTELLMQDATELFGEEFYVDGNAPANLKRMLGLESLFANAGTAASGNGAVAPTGSYAGLSCVPGNYGGTWNSGAMAAWPNGKGDTSYDFWSPLIIDYGDPLFAPSGGGNTWVKNCVEAIAYGIIISKKSKSQKGMLDLVMVDHEMYRQYLTSQRGLQRISVMPGNEQSDLIALGFTDVFRQDGVDITSEFGIPQGTGYGFNLDQAELCSQQSDVFVGEGPDLDIASKSWRWSIDMFGNLKWNPKYQVKFTNLTNTSDAA